MRHCGRRARIILFNAHCLGIYTLRKIYSNDVRRIARTLVMNQAKELFAAGKLNEAIQELLLEVKANPGDASRRTFLFELSCLAGDWGRAERQLDVIGHQSAEAELGVMVYRANINAERERRRVFAEGVQPHFLR